MRFDIAICFDTVNYIELLEECHILMHWHLFSATAFQKGPDQHLIVLLIQNILVFSCYMQTSSNEMRSL